MTFAADMQAISKRIDATLEEFGRAVKIAAFSQVIDNTRVDTGRMKGNWLLTENRPASMQFTSVDPSGSRTKADIRGNAMGISDSYLTNNLPYAPIWDEKDAIRARVLVNIQRNIRNAARAAK